MIQHGLFGRKENWKTIGKELNHITNRTVYNIDGRNHGESPHTDEMTFALMAKDIKQFCEQNSQITEVQTTVHQTQPKHQL